MILEAAIEVHDGFVGISCSICTMEAWREPYPVSPGTLAPDDSDNEDEERRKYGIAGRDMRNAEDEERPGSKEQVGCAPHVLPPPSARRKS